jgi:epoxyqueuosine reductase
MNHELLRILEAWPCCALATVPVPELPARERSFFAGFMPAARTAIALAHHVTRAGEWTWYATAAGGERCAADDHARSVCRKIRARLIRAGHPAAIVPYPGTSGLQFRYVAQAAGLGAIGLNAFLFHPAWGPWVHLRVLATTARLDIRPSRAGEQLCDRCGRCVPACPAGAIGDGAFSGRLCRAWRQARGEYEPHGPLGELRYCKRCIMVCPRGQRPSARKP